MSSELSCCSIRLLLLADVAANFFQLKPDRGNGVPSSPQVLTGKVPFLTTESGNGNGALPLQEPVPGELLICPEFRQFSLCC